MRLPHGGYTPRVAGRPKSDIEEVALPDVLLCDLSIGDLNYAPAVREGQTVGFGDPLATAQHGGVLLEIPSPAGGVVQRLIDGGVEMRPTTTETYTDRFKPKQPERTTADEIRATLTAAGIWPFFWSSATGGMPAADGSEQPAGIVVNLVVAEPFRARGRLILTRSWNRIIGAIRFLPRILADYGRVEVILTHVHDPVAQALYKELSGHAWIRLHAVPVTYPIENPSVLTETVRRATRNYTAKDTMWVIQPMGIEAVGTCLVDGLPLHTRIVAVGGPGAQRPRHLATRIGTPLGHLLPDIDRDRTVTLRGGLLLGKPVDPAEGSVGAMDDAYVLLPIPDKRETLSFVRPGFDRTSFFPAFASRLTRGVDRNLSPTLRGERRPCIACGACEQVCPAGIIPQVVHRYLYREALEEAEKAGLDRCVDCNLCTYVCPSKIELAQEFAAARSRLADERAEVLLATQEAGE